jgi:hypothetical protein
MKDILVYVGLLWMTQTMTLIVMMVVSLAIEKVHISMMFKYFTVKISVHFHSLCSCEVCLFL